MGAYKIRRGQIEMKILHTVEFYYPSVGGAQEVVRQLSERLVKLGHDVTVATTNLPERKVSTHNGVKIIGFDISGRAATGYSGKDIDKYKRLLTEPSFDVVMNYAAQQWATDLAFEVLDDIKARKILVPCGFSGLYDPVFKDYFSHMPKVMKKYDATIYLAEDYRDINFAREHKLSNIYVVPNGAGADEFGQTYAGDIRKELGISADSYFVLLVGGHTGVKGHKETVEIFKKAQLRNATFLINGNDLGGGCTAWCKKQAKHLRYSLNFKLQKKRLLVKDLPRPQLVAAYKAADLFLFPSNIEASPLVLFEAMASKLPFLTADVGNTKEIIRWSGGGLLLPTTKDELGFSHVDIDGSSEMLEAQYKNRSVSKKLGEIGYRVWRKKFTWEIITKEYESIYRGNKP